jgi:hypothetical protein
MNGSFSAGRGNWGAFGLGCGWFGGAVGGENCLLASRQIHRSDLLELETITSFLLIND